MRSTPTITKTRGASRATRCLRLKHRHVNKPPLAESIREQCIDLECKVLWRWHRDNKGFLDASAPWRDLQHVCCGAYRASLARAQALTSESPSCCDGNFQTCAKYEHRGMWSEKYDRNQLDWVSKCCVNPRSVPFLSTKKGCSAQCPPWSPPLHTKVFSKLLDHPEEPHESVAFQSKRS